MTTFGAIRWDAWYSNIGSSAFVKSSLSPAEWQGRAPFWATVEATNLIRFDATQATMDAEIDAAVAGGLDYWAFLLYRRDLLPTFMAAFDLYQASSKKNLIKWAMMRQSNDWGSTGNYATQVGEAVAQAMQSNYQLVLTNRPLVYVFYSSADLASNWGGSLANFKAALDQFRADVQTAGRGNPYIVVLSSDPAVKTGLGADAASSYILQNQASRAQPYATLAAYVEGQWPVQAAAMTKIVPLCMAGWDRRPRIERPVQWEQSYQRPHFGLELYTQQPTPAELVSHVQAGLNYVSANPSVCDADTVLCYAWNEFDEGGWLCPTLGDPTGAKLTALAAVLA